MKTIICTLIFFALVSMSLSFSQDDNTYGGYRMLSISKKISLDLEKANLVDVLKMLSQQTGLNFVSTEVVKDRVLTLYLEDVPLKEALDIIFKANNLSYDYHLEADIFVVKEMGRPTIELKTKVYHLKYVRVESSRMQGEIATAMETEGGQTGGEEEGGIKDAIEKVLTEFGKVVEDPITNSLIVVDVPSQFPAIDQVINKLDIPLAKVMIEVEILDVSKRLIDQVGIKFGEGYGLYGKYSPGSKATAFPFVEHFFGAPGGAVNLGLLDLTTYSNIIQFLASDTTTKFLARPKILTLSNETAEVSLTTDEVIGIITTIAGETTTTTQEAERAETGTKLRVTPQVNLQTREITLFVELFNRESKDSGLAMSGLEGGNVKNTEERGTKSVLRLKDGEVLLIGGLITRDNTTSIYKIPLLGDIPILGRLFRYNSKDNEERELLVFLNPHILEDIPASLAIKRLSLHREQECEFSTSENDSLASRREFINISLDKISKFLVDD